MTWARIDDQLHAHPKIGELDPDLMLECIGLHALALSWIADQLTDGRIPKGQPARLIGRNADHLIAELLRVVLWEQSPEGGYQIHDYLDCNLSKDEVLAGREKARQRMNKIRGSREVPANCERTSDAPIPIPIPIEEEEREAPPSAPPKPSRAARDGDWVGAWVDAERREGREPGKAQKATFGRKVKEIVGLDPLIMKDTIARMAAEEKHPGVLPYVYGDCKRQAEREMFQTAAGGRNRVR